MAELEIKAANPGPQLELAKSYKENAKLQDQLKALTNELTATCQKLEETEGL